MNKIWQLLSSILILVGSSGNIKIANQSQIEIKQDNFKTNNELIDLETIKFQTLTFNFSQLIINELREWILKDINQTFEFYKINLDSNDYNVKPIDDDTLQQFSTIENYHLLITIYSQDQLKAINSTTLELINNLNGNLAPLEPPLSTAEPNKPLPTNKNKNLILMTSISILTISFLIIIIFLKSRLKKGIGIKKNKNGKNSYYSVNKNKMKKNEENTVIKPSRQEKNIIKMKNKIKKYQTKIKKAKKMKKIKRKDNFNEKSNSKIN